jgi:N-succinyldiaminopimelate aminotransferase
MLNPRLQQFTDFPFQRLRDALAPLTPPAGLDPIFLSLGEPAHGAPPMIAEAVAANAALWGKYPPPEGTPELNRAITDWLIRRYDLVGDSIDPGKHIVPVAGTKEALFLAGLLVVPPAEAGEKLPTFLQPNPFYNVYLGTAVMAGAEPVMMSATKATGFLPDIRSLSDADWQRAAAVLVCTPANPQGAVADLNYLTYAIEQARRHDTVLLVDECYAEIYDREPPPGALQACQAMGDGFTNVLVFHSLSKRSSAPGLRSGFVAGDSDLIRGFKHLRAHAAATIPMPVMAASTALWREESHVEANRALYRTKFDMAEQRLAGSHGFYRPPAGFFLWLNVGDGEETAKKLWSEAAVRVLPGGYVSRDDANGNNPGKQFIRIALVGSPAMTAEALDRIVKVL